MRHSFLDRYREGSSPVHKLDPRLKLGATLGFVLVTTATPAEAWPAFAFLATLALGAVALSRVPFWEAMRRSSIVLPFVGLVAISLPFTHAGEPLWSAHIAGLTLTITDAGLMLFISVVLKAWLAVMVSGLLVATTPFPNLLQAMRSLHLPAVLISTISFMYRYLFVLTDEAMRLQTAREARSAGPGRTLWWRARVVGGMIGSLFIRSYERSERIYAAMLSRGYAGEVRALSRLSWNAGDGWAGAIWAAALILAALLGRLSLTR